MKKRIAEILILVCFLAFVLVISINHHSEEKHAKIENAVDTEICYTILSHQSFDAEEEEIRNEIMYGELELLAILVQAESGNQDELGKRYVADVVLNRVDDKVFPDSIEEVIRQDKQFSCIIDGNYTKAEFTVTEDCFQIVLEEYECRTDSTIEYFRTERYSDSGKPAFKYGDHYFSRR